ncbi:site-2 protease family protein [Pseudalkalibacillus sp. SCS-8]|uniref:site-2 protease family protein n=1 Tax=Pseudalkalibacillus nanhaiensis TaxID=3115291 RepID=UPI0032DA9C7F
MDVILLTIFLLFPVSNLLHELGHYITARSSGIQDTELRIGYGPVIFHINNTFLNMKVGLFYFAGAYTAWSGTSALNPIHRVLISMNGPLVNMVVAVYGWVLLRRGPSVEYEMTLSIFVMINLWIAVGNLLPYKLFGKSSDGLVAIKGLWQVLKRI